VINPSPFETLSLDFASAKIVIQTDAFQALMSGQSGSLQKLGALASVSKVPIPGAVGFVETEEQKLARLTNSLAAISVSQRSLLSRFDISSLIPQLAKILQPPPPTACDDAKRYADAKAKGMPLPDPNPWFNIDDWKAMMLAQLELDGSGKPLVLAVVQAQLQKFDADIKSITDEASGLNSADQATIKKTIDTVTQNQTSLNARLDLVAALRTPPLPTNTVFSITDFNPKDPNSLQANWTLNYTNLTGISVKRVVATPYKPASPADAVLSPPSKQPVVALSIQYQTVARLEFATGVMVPVRPFHSYSAAAIATNGAVTGSVVQETLTYTVVPLALVNFVIRQGNLRKQPVALFGTIGTGYNPATSSVEFGVGPSFSWKSIMLSGLVDIGRDTQLAGGFTVGQALPASNPPKPLTVTGWFAKPAIALSVRIPLGGSSK
jgi:hypothetical protein